MGVTAETPVKILWAALAAIISSAHVGTSNAWSGNRPSAKGVGRLLAVRLPAMSGKSAQVTTCSGRSFLLLLRIQGLVASSLADVVPAGRVVEARAFREHCPPTRFGRFWMRATASARWAPARRRGQLCASPTRTSLSDVAAKGLSD